MRLGTTTRLALASAILSTLMGILEVYFLLGVSPVPQSGYSPQTLAVAYASLVLTYPITVVVFYAIGRRRPTGFITVGNLFAIFGGALLGEILGQTIFSFFPLSSVSSAPLLFSIVSAPSSSLGFLFIALSGFALSNLSHPSSGSVNPGRGVLVASIAALAFGTVGSLLGGVVSLNISRLSNTQLGYLLFDVSASSVIISFAGQLLVFYYIGRKYPINGRTFRYFGQLFLGLYVGSIIGTVASVALFGQNSWALPPGQGSLGLENGIVYQNTAPSLKLLLQALNPIGSLPFLSFFAMSLSRTAPPSPSARDGVGAESYPSPQPAQAT